MVVLIAHFQMKLNNKHFNRNMRYLNFQACLMEEWVLSCVV